MTFYTVHLRPDAEPVLVREGFAWGAALLGPLWLALRGAWIAAGISLLAFVLIATLTAAPASLLLTGGLAFVLGLVGNDLRRRNLERKGFVLLHVVAARGPQDALLRLLTHRPDLGARYRPEPAG